MFREDRKVFPSETHRSTAARTMKKRILTSFPVKTSDHLSNRWDSSRSLLRAYNRDRCLSYESMFGSEEFPFSNYFLVRSCFSSSCFLFFFPLLENSARKIANRECDTKIALSFRTGRDKRLEEQKKKKTTVK